jgi:hypothetical protein
MRDQLDPPEVVVAKPQSRIEPWAVALNASAEGAAIQITLCSFIVVGEFSRVTGVIRVQTSQDVRLASIPTLSIASPGMPPLQAVSAHVLPQGPLTWVSWLYRHTPPDERCAYEARIDRVDVGFAVGKRAPESIDGPWTFRFEVPVPPAERPTRPS